MNIIFCQRLDSNRRPLDSEVPTEPHYLPIHIIVPKLDMIETNNPERSEPTKKLDPFGKIQYQWIESFSIFWLKKHNSIKPQNDFSNAVRYAEISVKLYSFNYFSYTKESFYLTFAYTFLAVTKTEKAHFFLFQIFRSLINPQRRKTFAKVMWQFSQTSLIL